MDVTKLSQYQNEDILDKTKEREKLILLFYDTLNKIDIRIILVNSNEKQHSKCKRSDENYFRCEQYYHLKPFSALYEQYNQSSLNLRELFKECY